MHLFRSEENARNWSGFVPDMEHTLLSMERWAEIFTNPFFSERGRADYISWTRSEAGQAAFAELRAQLAPDR